MLEIVWFVLFVFFLKINLIIGLLYCIFVFEMDYIIRCFSILMLFFMMDKLVVWLFIIYNRIFGIMEIKRLWVFFLVLGWLLVVLLLRFGSKFSSIRGWGIFVCKIFLFVVVRYMIFLSSFVLLELWLFIIFLCRFFLMYCNVCSDINWYYLCLVVGMVRIWIYLIINFICFLLVMVGFELLIFV